MVQPTLHHNPNNNNNNHHGKPPVTSIELHHRSHDHHAHPTNKPNALKRQPSHHRARVIWYKSKVFWSIIGAILMYGLIFSIFVGVLTHDSSVSHSSSSTSSSSSENHANAKQHNDNNNNNNNNNDKNEKAQQQPQSQQQNDRNMVEEEETKHRVENPSVLRTAVANKLAAAAAAANVTASLDQLLCPYTTLDDLTSEERVPKEGSRHIVQPPKDTTGGHGVSLVCCPTTQGPLSIVVHHAWAPNRAKRFLDMVESGYFDTKVPFMRCLAGFLCQFGLNGSKLQQQFKSTIQDDPNWLPEGKEFRERTDTTTGKAVKRFAQGYLAYAGHGPNSRNNQLIVALDGNGPLGGGSPWEVPWGELVGAHSFETLSKLYTGYGEEGPSQGLLWKKGSLKQVEEQFPKLDYILNCWIQDRGK